MNTQPVTDPGRAWVEVDLPALVSNAAVLARVAGRPLLPMVKANGYGLGAVAVARALDPIGPWGFGVATLDEAAELRDAGIARPLVVFTPLVPAAVPRSLALGVRPVVGDLPALRAWIAASDGPFHLEVDTGMSRAGFRWSDADALAAAFPLLQAASGWEGVFTHFHSADVDPAATGRQWDLFTATIAALPRRPALVHAANSAAALQGQRYAADLVRPGIFLYGGGCGGRAPNPVARLRASVVAVRCVGPGEPVSYGATWRAGDSTRIATLALGYADGLHRALSGKGCVELGNAICPIAGRVTMDMTMVAAGEGCRVGEVATVFGGLVSLDDQAEAAGTISYELLTSLGTRVERRYV
ncbi:MAG TPA: alanine racemase [Vicinamibacterales bacterium]|nr:alanine racemase [Vicinamibacterales bacterium]